MADESPQGLQCRFETSNLWERFRSFSPVVVRSTFSSAVPSSVIGEYPLPSQRKTSSGEELSVSVHSLSLINTKLNYSAPAGDMAEKAKPAKVSLARVTIDAPPSKVDLVSSLALPDQISLLIAACQQCDSRGNVCLQVYEKLADVQSWNDWHKSAWVLRAPGLERLTPGEKFSYTAPFVLGNVCSEVTQASPNQVHQPRSIGRSTSEYCDTCYHPSFGNNLISLLEILCFCCSCIACVVAKVKFFVLLAQTLEWSDKALFGLINGGHRWRLQGKGRRLLGFIGKQQTQVVLDQEVTGASCLAHLFVGACYVTIARGPE